MDIFDVLPRDQVYFILSQICALVFAIIYHYIDSYDPYGKRNDSQKLKHLLMLTIPGLFISYICYGNQIIHIVILSSVSYGLFYIVSPKWIHLTTLVIAMIHLSYLHIDRLVNDYSIYTIDITAPIMILVQKVSSVAFSINDDMYHRVRINNSQNDKKSETYFEQKRFHFIRYPTFFEYFAFVFNFQTVICGPLVFYEDFISFIDGEKLRNDKLDHYPSTLFPVVRKLAIAIVCGLLVMSFVPHYPASLLLLPSFTSASFLYKLWLLYWVAFSARLKYYFAWTLSEAVSNASGLGFNGLDEKTKQPRWDLMDNIDIIKFENAFSQRDSIRSWNKTTEAWLRRTAYERAPKKYKVLMTFILSAIWHGFHPGYYLTFLTGALFTLAARTGRRCFRHRFQQKSPTIFNFYHLLTWITTRIAMAYLAFPFIILEFNGSLQIYNNLIFFGHLVALAMYLFLPLFFEPLPNQSSKRHQSEKLNCDKSPSNGNKYLSEE